MNVEWYACLPVRSAACLSPLRQDRAIEVLVGSDDWIWLRGPTLDDTVRKALQSTLGSKVFRPLGDGELVPQGNRVPHGYEPKGDWIPLADWLTTELPARRFAIRTIEKVQLSLIRSHRIESPQLVCVPWTDWLSYAVTAPQARLDRLVFATSREHAVVIGQPLPPIRGDYYWLRDQIATPVGFTWSPQIDAKVLSDLFQLNDDDIAILQADGGYCVIRNDQFVGAARSAVRLTEEAIHAEP